MRLFDNPRFHVAALTSAFGLASVLSLSGCRGRDVEFDCEFSRDTFEEQEEDRGKLLDEISADGPFPGAIVLTGDGINQLLGGAVEGDVPFTGSVPFGPSIIEFEPDGDPVIEVADVPGCSNCIIYSIEFVVELKNGDVDFASGTGLAKLAVPIVLEDNGDGSTTLIAQYEDSEIDEFDVTVYGLDSDEHQGMSDAISILMERNVREQFGPTELMSFEPFGIGDGDVFLAARRLTSYPEGNAVALELATNIKLPGGSDLEVDPELPEGINMSMQFGTPLLLGLIQRMLTEGAIPQFYDQDGEPDSNGEFAASMEEMNGSSVDDTRLDSVFRVWRLEGGFCGYAEANLPLFAEIEEDEDLRITPGNVEVLRGKGIGSLAAEEDQVVKDNQHLLDNFRSAVAKHVGLTVNYDALSIPGKAIYFFTKGVNVTEGALRTHMEFVVAEAPGG